MQDERVALIQTVLSAQSGLFRALRPAQEWLEVELTMPQLKVLYVLYFEGASRMGHLAASLGVTLSTVTGIVDRLVEHDFVRREEDPQDRRLVVCRLTTQGSDTVERLHQAGRGRMAQLLDGLALEDLRAVAGGLDILLAAARREVAGAGGETADSKRPCWRTDTTSYVGAASERRSDPRVGSAPRGSE